MRVAELPHPHPAIIHQAWRLPCGPLAALDGLGVFPFAEDSRTRRWSTTATSLGVIGRLAHIASFLVVGWPWLSLSFGKDDMKRFLNLVILVSLVGVFFSGFVCWKASSSHQNAERRRQREEYIPPGNAPSVARNMGLTCAGFVVLALAGLGMKVLCRT
jgi:hypothetical protein